MNEPIAQFTSAPRLIIAMPMYNFGITAWLKVWLDNSVAPVQDDLPHYKWLATSLWRQRRACGLVNRADALAT